MEAEDIVMEAMTYYWGKQDPFVWSESSCLYFTTIKNKCLNYLRDRQYYQAVSRAITEHAAWKLAIQISTLETCFPEELFKENEAVGGACVK